MNTRTAKRSIIAGAAAIVFTFTAAACGADNPAGDVTKPGDKGSSENKDFTPKYGEHSDNFVKKGPATGGNKAHIDSQP